jgi:glycosyltransferase involved in cell wall biosynthesis
MIGKYPPIEGGVSATNYQYARMLAQTGHEVHVVTNAAEVERKFRLFFDDGDAAMLAGKFPSGGSVTVHAPGPDSNPVYIPWANPYVTKLAGLAKQVIAAHGCELVFAYYLEPYGMAAHLASHWTGVPYAITHAGSDVGHLMKIEELQASYAEILRRADVVIPSGATTREAFRALGVPERRFVSWPPRSIPTDLFHPDIPPLAVDDLLRRSRGWRDEELLSDRAKSLLAGMAQRRFDPAVPTIGIYGKVGKAKGSFDLIRALGALKRRHAFQLLALSGGHPERFERFLTGLERAGIVERTWVLPFVPLWRVGSFIRACSAVCFLERDFNIKSHNPRVAREVLACGTALVLSGEIARKQPFRHRLVDGENFLLVPDPAAPGDLYRALEAVVTDPDRARRIGAQGFRLSREVEDFSTYREAVDRTFQDIRARAHAGFAGGDVEVALP